jgi:protein TonB
VWEVEDKPVSILFNLDVLDRIRDEVIRGFAALPRRGLEVGGILLGRCEHLSEKHYVVTIEAFHSIESEHSLGPQYSLTEHERQELEHQLTISRLAETDTLRVIGFYRSQTRAGLQLEPEDLELFDSYFSDPSSVFLIVKPSISKGAIAGFFFWENGVVQRECYAEFPFHRREMQAAGFQILQNPFGSPATNVVPAEVIHGQDSDEPLGTIRRLPGMAAVLSSRPSAYARWVWAPLLLALIMLAALLANRKSPSNRTETAAQFGYPADLHLSAERLGNGLRLSWDRKNPLVEKAQNGVLWIRDGGADKRLELDNGQLTNGSVMYWPTSSDVSFRMDVATGAKKVSESLRAYSGEPTPKAEVIAEAPRKEPATARPITQPQPERTQTRSRRREDKPQMASTREQPRTNSALDQKPSPFVVAVPANDSPAIASLEPPRIEHASGSLTSPPIQERIGVQIATVAVEPVPESAFRRVVQTVPGLRRLQRHRYKAGDHFTPAKPVRQMAPRIPHAIARDLKQETPVDLRVNVEHDGSISHTELASDTRDKRLIGLSMEALKYWRFEPARIGNKPVPSKVLLHFRFRPATLTAMR